MNLPSPQPSPIRWERVPEGRVRGILSGSWSLRRLQGGNGVSPAGGVDANNGTIPDQDLAGFIAGPGALSQAVSDLVANTEYQLSFACDARSASGTEARLQVKAAGKGIVTWPVSAQGLVLQEASALPGGWANSAATVTEQGPLSVAEIAPTGISRFCRLTQ